MDTPGYIKLNTVVHKYIDRAGQTTAKYRRLYSLAVDCLTELTMDVAGVLKTCKLSVLPNKTAELPMDYLDWSKVGVLNNHGEVACLDFNSNLTRWEDNSIDRLNKNSDDSVGGFYRYGNPFFFNNYLTSGIYYNLFGIAGTEYTSLGKFNIDKKKALILLDNCFNFDYVMLEYLSMPDEDEEYEIPIQLQAAVIAWLGFRDIEFFAASRNVSIYDKRARRDEWLREKRLAKERMQPFRLQIANQYTRETIKLVAKA